MRFKRGSMVEVLSKKDLLNAWRCAEIVGDDGDGYTVRYHRGSGMFKAGVNKVRSEAVRPCPRPVMAPKDLVEGDVVEVLDEGFWRVSVIKEIMEDDFYYIQVIGSLDEFRVKNSSIRARQEWKENKWITMDKGSENCEDLISRMLRKYPVQPQSKATNAWKVLESDLVFQSWKRSSPDHAFADKAYPRSVKRRRLGDEEVDLDAIHGDAYSFIGKELCRNVSLTVTLLKMM